MHWPVTSQADACTSQAYACMYCMHCPMTSQADACSYCMGSVVLISSQIYLYLQLLWTFSLFVPTNISYVYLFIAALYRFKYILFQCAVFYYSTSFYEREKNVSLTHWWSELNFELNWFALSAQWIIMISSTIKKLWVLTSPRRGKYL
jgi:hypothetical protein